MPQISLYVDEETLEKVENAAAREDKSISKWVVEQLKAKLDPVYPKNFEQLFGSVNDSSFTRPEEIPYQNDVERDSF